MKHVITFTEGMDKDTTFNKYPNTKYLHSENFRFIYDEENSVGILSNEVGNTKVIEFSGNYLGATTIRDSLILFLLNSENITEIHQIELQKLEQGVVTVSDSSAKLKLDFQHNKDTKIKALGRYESENIEKLYWTDGISFKYCNLKDSNLAAQSIEKFEAYPENTVAEVEVTGFISGGLLSGKVQYGYQLYNVNGSATNINSLSPLINVTTSTSGHTKNFIGDVPGVATNKGCEISISGIDTNFDRIRLYRIFYTDNVQLPEMYLIDEVSVDGRSSISFQDVTSVGMGQVAFEELIKMKADLLFETLEAKNNLLFVGDVTEKVFDISSDIDVEVVVGETFPDDGDDGIDLPDGATIFTFSVSTGEGGEVVTPIGDPSSAIEGASVVATPTIGSDVKSGITNSSGIVSLTLRKIEYTYQVNAEGYLPASGILDANVNNNISIIMSPIDNPETATLTTLFDSLRGVAGPSGTYEVGTSINLSGIAASGYKVWGWQWRQGSQWVLLSRNNPHTIILNNNLTVRCIFVSLGTDDNFDPGGEEEPALP